MCKSVVYMVIHIHTGLVYECSGYHKEDGANNRAGEIAAEYSEDWDDGNILVYAVNVNP